MAKTQSELVQEIARVFIFEYWARFYYTQETTGHAVLEVPEDVLMECRREHPDLFPLLEKGNHALLSAEESQRQVGAHVLASMEGGGIKPGEILKIFDSKAFRIELHMFSMWIKGHETYLDEKHLTFADWMEHYHNWRALDQVKAFAARIELGQDQQSSTVH